MLVMKKIHVQDVSSTSSAHTLRLLRYKRLFKQFTMYIRVAALIRLKPRYLSAAGDQVLLYRVSNSCLKRNQNGKSAAFTCISSQQLHIFDTTILRFHPFTCWVLTYKTSETFVLQLLSYWQHPVQFTPKLLITLT